MAIRSKVNKRFINDTSVCCFSIFQKLNKSSTLSNSLPSFSALKAFSIHWPYVGPFLVQNYKFAIFFKKKSIFTNHFYSPTDSIDKATK